MGRIQIEDWLTPYANGNIDQVVQTILRNPEGIVRELEADAMATYSMVLAQNYTIESLPKVVAAAEAIGDRLTENPFRHGTPEQRSCAVRWAADEALKDQKISPREFRVMFQKHYMRIRELDPSACAFAGTPEVLTQEECGSSPQLTPKSSSLQTEIWISACMILIVTLGLLNQHSGV